MKKAAMSLLILCFVVVVSSIHAAEFEVKVTGMHCGGCEQTIEAALREQPAVQSVKADHKTGIVRVNLEDGKPFSDSELGQILKKLGYPPEVAE